MWFKDSSDRNGGGLGERRGRNVLGTVDPYGEQWD